MFSNLCWGLSLSCVLLTLPDYAQVRTGSGGSAPSTSSRSSVPSSTANPPPEARAVVIHGRVIMQDGSPLREPIAIERVCNGAVRREGYTDFKGSFEFQLGQESVERDATESGRDVFQNSGNRGPTTGPDSEYGMGMPTNPRNTDATRPELFGCELRAALAGFKTTSVLLRPDGSTWSLDVGSIVITPMENVSGSTVSMASLAAPTGARQAYEKGEKALERGKFPEAERELKKALAEYPAYAAAWSMLGEVQRHNADFAQAKEDYLKATALDPKFINPYYGMAIISVHEKNWSDVLKYTDQVTKLNPAAYPLANMYNAAANYYLGNTKAAEESILAFQKSDNSHQNPDSSLLLSNILLAKHDYDGAAKALEEYLKIVPNAPNAVAIRKQIKDLNDMSQASQK